ncbi:hypothetical protein N474_22530 [Pseudoalteromonas luteoviolacea CPMOR-2]|uniref:DUF4440 domain-containing protein n=1 Tax=Pseudoalteromonas luteoviolacea DSM 6061 TaxID=1365250 RepID=A0A166VWY1_9GAMM|nr:nuclear transport factor 2 family protein [Pseudoalteromonas luteoviolacea]KZN34101.1 hypothetical protein N475_19290 [Pseudoalteromonas luteoviolacea DSM 6061]KZN52749.1 hypothetical protein N474_22530 [Pseudoalteromonas luteoviolacea CPMOR-2]MBE0389698.1 hypothetical protein [Pseudoalteromonas luteoviolacea DSM 6061]
MNRLLFIITSLICVSLMAFKANAHNFMTPQEAINSYVQGVTNGVGKDVEKAFQETATIQFYDSRGSFNNFNRNQFIELINTGNKWSAKVEITSLLITKNAASATVEFNWGKSKEHGFVDYLNLIFDGQKWQITSKVAQYVSKSKSSKVDAK